MLVFIAEKKNLSKVALGILLHHGHPVEHGPLEVEFHHHSDVRESDCPPAPSRAPRLGVHWGEVKALDGRSRRIRCRV
jgi:hypothetical protein